MVRHHTLGVGLLVGIAACAPTRAFHEATESSSRPLGSNLLLNGDAEGGANLGPAPWTLVPRFWARDSEPSLTTVPASEEEDHTSTSRLVRAGRALEVHLRGRWSVERVIQEFRGQASSYRLEGLIRVSDGFEGSVQATLASTSTLAISPSTQRAWLNSDRPVSVFLPLRQEWSRFAVELPQAPEAVMVLSILIEGRGKVWLDDLELRPRL
jgi:hypothetical protein